MTYLVNQIEPGDIVWCWFPNFNPADPTLKPRPGLVISVMDDASPARLRIAYGTTQSPKPYGRGAFVVEKAAHLEQAGLASITRFNLKNLVVLEYTSNFFTLAPLAGGLKAPTPKMGTLPAPCMPEFYRAAKEAGLMK